jgi:hypothetical protein
MTEFEYLHEAEDVWLVSGTLRWCAEVWAALSELGFEMDEDVFTMDRPEKVPVWQSRSIVAVHVLRGDREVYDEHSQWDRVRLRYLLATLPGEALEVFVEKAVSAADRLRLPMQYRGRLVTKEQLRADLSVCQQELRETVGEPGSKEVAAAIEMTHPRRP